MLKITDHNRKWWVLLAMSCALALVFIDQTAISVVLVTIQRELSANSTDIHWVINAYLLTLSAVILLGGSMGDAIGHKRMFLFGITLFAFASALCGFAYNSTELILARVLQGIGGAFMMPCASALVVNNFSDNERGKAMGIYVGIAAIFLAVGPLLGGVLTQWISWRAIFWINVPISLISILLTAHVLPPMKAMRAFNLDTLGFLLSAACMISIVLYFMEAPTWGWISMRSLCLILTILISIAAFILWEHSRTTPLIDLKLFKNTIFTSILSITFIGQAVGTVFIFWSIFLQIILHYSVVDTGFLLLPFTIPLMIIAPIAGRLRDRYGPRIAPLCGTVLGVCGFILVGSSSHLQNYHGLFPGFLLCGIAMPMILSGSIATGLSAVSEQQRATASAIINCVRQLGISIGLAILSGLLNSLNDWKLTQLLKHGQDLTLSQLNAEQIDGLLSGSASALKIVARLTVQESKQVISAATAAYNFAFSKTMYIAASFTLLIFVCILKLPKHFNNKIEK